MEPVLKVFWNAFSLAFLIFFTVKIQENINSYMRLHAQWKIWISSSQLYVFEIPSIPCFLSVVNQLSKTMLFEITISATLSQRDDYTYKSILEPGRIEVLLYKAKKLHAGNQYLELLHSFCFCCKNNNFIFFLRIWLD